MSASPKPKPESRILIVDDHPLFRKGLRELIEREPGWSVCEEAATSDEAIRLVEETKPNLVIVDITLAGTNGIDLIKSLVSQNAALPLLVISMHDESLYAERAVRAGAMGYVMKDETPRIVKSAIQRVLAGEMYLSEKMSASIITRLMRGGGEKAESPVSRLSDREIEIFRLLGRGRETKQIAQELNLTIATINSYRARIKEKLGLNSPTELLHKAISWVQQETTSNSSQITAQN